MKILVVDDEIDIKSLFQQRFRKEIKERTIDFAFANSGGEALSYLEQHSNETTLVLSDINMPGMSGLELLKEIKQNWCSSASKVLMITAYGDQENYNEAMRLGANDLLTKPINFTELKEKLNTCN